MDINLNKYDKIISLGTTCTFSFLFSLKNFHRCIFDSAMATSMWAICQLLNNNFDGFLSDMAYQKMYDGLNGFTIYDKKYFIRTFGTNPTSPDFIAFCKSMQEKACEFMNELSTLSGNILFLRHEEKSYHNYYGNRIDHPDFNKYFEKPEIDYLKDFSNIIKNINPNIRFKILFISDNDDCFIDDEHNIIGIPDNPLAEFMNKHLHMLMTEHINNHSKFLSINI